MKKMILFMAALLLLGTTAQANDHKHADHKERVNNPIKKLDRRYRHSRPIVFIEGGVKFLVYKNGEIDFRSIRRNRNVNWNDTYYAPGRTRYQWNPNRFTVKYDLYGRLKRVGLNTIGYNRYDQVRRIGSVLIRYNRRGLVSQVGGLNIYYNRYGKIRHIEGQVHHTGCGFCGVDSCNAPHRPSYDLDWDNYQDDDGEYYKNRKRKKRYEDDDDD